MPEEEKNKLPLVLKKAQGKRCARARSGVYSWISSKRIPQGRTFQKIRRELSIERERFEAEHLDSHGEVPPGTQALIDGTIEAEGVVKLIGLYLRRQGVVDGAAAKRGSLELSPLLARSWVTYQNCIRQNVVVLEEMKRARAKGGDPGAGPTIVIEEASESVVRPAGRGAEGKTDEPGDTGPGDEKGDWSDGENDV